MLINDDWKVMYEAAERDIAGLRAQLAAEQSRREKAELDLMLASASAHNWEVAFEGERKDKESAERERDEALKAAEARHGALANASRQWAERVAELTAQLEEAETRARESGHMAAASERAASAAELALARMREALDQIREQARSIWGKFKGGYGPERGNPYYEGHSDGLDAAAVTIEGCLTSLPVSTPAQDFDVWWKSIGCHIGPSKALASEAFFAGKRGADGVAVAVKAVVEAWGGPQDELLSFRSSLPTALDALVTAWRVNK